MDLQIAKSAIDTFMRETECFTGKRRIDFLGGEPLVAYDLIHDICEWVWTTFKGISVSFFVTTNGSLLTMGMKNWFYENRNRITACLSYDGKHAQMRNRDFCTLDTAFFRDTWPHQACKMTVTEESVTSLFDDICDLYDTNTRFVFTFAMGTSRWKPESIIEFSLQMDKLVDYYCNHSNTNFLQDFLLDLPAVLSKNKKYLHCGVGNEFSVVDTDGIRYPCQMISSLTMQEEDLVRIPPLTFWKTAQHKVEGLCSRCILDIICPICYGMSFKKYHTPFARDPSICELFTILVKAACKYVVRRIVVLDELSDYDRLLADSVVVILGALTEEIESSTSSSDC